MTIGVVVGKNNIYGKWLEIRNQYKRQADLIPVLTNLTYNYLKYEYQTLLDVVEARAKILANALTGNNVTEIAKAGDDLNQYTVQLLAVAEAYPDLKGNTVVLELVSEVSGTQNRITVARRRFNENIVGYNNLLVVTPLARLFGYSEMRGLEFLETPENPPSIPEWEF